MTDHFIGIWYKCRDDNSIYKWIKLVPACRTLESQDPNKKYLSILGKKSKEDKPVILFESDYDSCKFAFWDIYQPDINIKQETYDERLLDELEQDAEFLERGAMLKDQEISHHIHQVIDRFKSLNLKFIPVDDKKTESLTHNDLLLLDISWEDASSDDDHYYISGYYEDGYFYQWNGCARRISGSEYVKSWAYLR